MSGMLEMLQAMADGEAPPAPVAELVGFDLVEVSDGRAVMELEAGEEHHNPMVTVHRGDPQAARSGARTAEERTRISDPGGVICDVADGAMGSAWASTMGPGETFTTLEMDAKFLRPVTEDTLRAEATVVKRGETTGLVECDVRSSDGDLVARCQSTVMALDADRGPADAPGV